MNPQSDRFMATNGQYGWKARRIRNPLPLSLRIRRVSERRPENSKGGSQAAFVIFRPRAPHSSDYTYCQT